MTTYRVAPRAYDRPGGERYGRRAGVGIRMTVTPKKIVYFVLFWTILSDTLIAELGLSGTIQYLNDVAWVILFACAAMWNFPSRFRRYGLGAVLGSMAAYAAVCFVSASINLVDPFLVLWATRNTLRFFAFYVACVVYLDRRDIDRIFSAFFVVQILSFLIALYQYYVLKFHMDNLGGIFGHGNGAALNTFQAMLFSYYLCGYLKKKQPLLKIVVVLTTSVIIAGLAEEKAFFAYLVVSATGCLLFNKLSLKGLVTTVLIVAAVPVGITLLSTANGSWNLNVLTDFGTAMDYMNSAYKISRLNPFPQINGLFFQDDLLKKLLGVGFGGAESCEASALLTSDFFRQYAYLQYSDFTQQKILIETGLLGFGSYLCFFIANIASVWKKARACKRDDYRFRSAAVFGAVAILSCWFSGALIFGDAYLVFFGVAAGAVMCKPCDRDEDNARQDSPYDIRRA